MTEAIDFMHLSAACAPSVHAATMHRVLRVESSFNPYAIGVVGGALRRQPNNRWEALDAIAALENRGANYSVGLAQINKHNFRRYGLNADSALEPCINLHVGARILTDCYQRALPTYGTPQRALRAALSCYESGNFRTGMLDGYVAKVVRAKASTPLAPRPPPASSVAPPMNTNTASLK